MIRDNQSLKASEEALASMQGPCGHYDLKQSHTKSSVAIISKLKKQKMDQAEIDNWAKIAASMEANGDTESWFYLRARAIADGKPDPMPNVSQLVQEAAS